MYRGETQTMKFTCNTKPFADSLDLGIINQNVSNFHQKSCTVELTASEKMLKINIEASQVFTEIHIPGKGEEGSATVFVDSITLKNLASTLESQTVTLQFDDNGLTIVSGKSKFTLPKLVDDADFDLKAPVVPDTTAGSIEISRESWKFVKDFQMYAISMAYITPIYTKVWVGENGDVLVGDFDNSLFTHSVSSNLGRTCLLSDTIINLFNSLPAGSTIVPVDDSYVIQLKTDSYEYITQFTPQYEDDGSVGNYNSQIFLEMMQHEDSSALQINTDAVTKALNQALLLSTNSQDSITFSIEDGHLHLTDKNVDCDIEGSGSSENYKVDFNLERLKKVISNYKDETINVSPMKQEGDTVGIMVWNNKLTTIVAGDE